ncbi:hypothetical protein D3C81_1571400 [compost metagenome]
MGKGKSRTRIGVGQNHRHCGRVDHDHRRAVGDGGERATALRRPALGVRSNGHSTAQPDRTAVETRQNRVALRRQGPAHDRPRSDAQPYWPGLDRPRRRGLPDLPELGHGKAVLHQRLGRNQSRVQQRNRRHPHDAGQLQPHRFDLPGVRRRTELPGRRSAQSLHRVRQHDRQWPGQRIVCRHGPDQGGHHLNR